MLKKIISLMIAFAMLVPFSSAVAADENASQPTIEEILNGYHERAFAAQTAEENGDAATYARRSGSEKTLEEETVDELNAAGYEAYNVTAANYESLEASLQTDFSQLGIDPEGSYVVVISNDNSTSISPAQNPRLVDLPHYEYGEDPGTSFSYTYDNGETFTMRFVTVTADENSNLGKTSAYPLMENTIIDIVDNFLNTIIYYILDSAASASGFPIPIGTVSSIAGIQQIDLVASYPATFYLNVSTTWTRRYLQVYDEEANTWITRVNVEYATSTTFLTGSYYSSSLKNYTGFVDANPVVKREYTSHYNDLDWMQEEAALAEIGNTFRFEHTGGFIYFYDKNGSGQYDAGEPIFIHTEVYDVS